MSEVCAVIPAAGRGSRLGLEVPKILAPVDGARTVWSFLRDRLLPSLPRIHVVLSPEGVRMFEREIASDPERARISTSVQRSPLGMGDAIFGARRAWEGSRRILILWGDQVNISAKTIREALAAAQDERCVVLPLATVNDAYVQYDFDVTGRLIRVRQSREGDHIDSGALADVGLFALSTAGLVELWRTYLDEAAPGEATGEVNFLPFLSYLSVVAGWEIRTVRVDDPMAAVGINTQAALEWSRRRLLAGEERKAS